jgi:hypothetical protein
MVTSIGGSLLGNSAQKAQAAKENAYNAQMNLVQEQNRTKQMEYETEIYARDIDYRKQVLKFQETEFDRQVEFVDRARDNMEENYFTKVGTLLVRAFEEQIVSSFEKQEVQAQGRAARATVNNMISERNIDGNTARQLEGELFRQEGESLTQSDLNDTARERQLRLDVLGLKAEHDGKVGSLQLQASAPLAPLRGPSPVPAVAPPKQVSGPSDGALGINIATAAITGIGGYMKSNGYKF